MSTWMVVEDEPDIYEVLLAMFEMWGIEGVAFVDGEEAVAWIDEVDKGMVPGELPELALLDIRLPGPINGPRVGERLRKSPHLKDVTIVLTTAYHLSGEEEKEAMTRAGADKLIYKPLPKFHELKQMLEELIAQRRARVAAETARQTARESPRKHSTAKSPASQSAVPPPRPAPPVAAPAPPPAKKPESEPPASPLPAPTPPAPPADESAKPPEAENASVPPEENAAIPPGDSL